MAGTSTFIFQVSQALPSVPNLRPAIKMTLGTRGRAAICASSVRSQEMVSTCSRSSSDTTKGSVKRETAYTLRETPLFVQARRSMTDSVGPTLPPAPRIMISPSSVFKSSMSASLGVESSSSSHSSVHISIADSSSGIVLLC